MIKKASIKEADEATKLALLLFTTESYEVLKEELEKIILHYNAVIYLYYIEQKAVGFAQCQMRYDYVEGSSSSPVGYLEGIYVMEEYRNQGIAKQLINACENWSRKNECSEFASDCEFNNNESIILHKKLGFQEANRIICFIKKL